MTWVVFSGIFPSRFRGVAVAVAAASSWIACFILTYTFPLLKEWPGAAGTFWLYGAICVGGFGFIFLRLPETKNKTLEAIEQDLVK